MSAPNETNNPWVTLAELLKSGVSEAILANTIERDGVQTYDRFGRRRVAAIVDEFECTATKARALDLLADHYSYLTNAQMPDELASDALFQEEPDFYKFGWPKDELPNFYTINSEEVPKIVKKPKQIILASNAALQQHKNYLVVIAALFNFQGIAYDDSHITSRIVSHLDRLGISIDDETVKNMFNNIENAIKERKKKKSGV